MEGKWVTEGAGKEVVIFVHGVLSSGETCWKNPNGAYWPDLIAADSKLSHVGVYVFTYKTGFLSGSFRIGNVVDSLKEHLELDDVLSRRVINFVCHSMGGLVVRKFLVERAIHLADADLEIRLFLIASPSLGSRYANWLEPVARFLGHTQADAMRFEQDNSWLMDLDKEFLNLLTSHRLKLSGKELIEDKFLIGSPFLKTQIVEPFAGAKYFPDSYKVPDSDHFSIAKPRDAKATQYRLLQRFLLPNAAKLSSQGPSRDRPDETTQSAAAARDSRDATITIGLNEEGVRRVLSEELERIAQERGVPAAPLQAVLTKLGQAGVPKEEIVAHLDVAAGELIDLRARLSHLQNERPELAKARENALVLVDRGELDEARASLCMSREATRKLRKSLTRDEAELLADEARIDRLQLDHRSAAEKFHRAAVLVAQIDADAEMRFLTEHATSLKDRGKQIGDRNSVLNAVAVYRKCLDRPQLTDQGQRAGVLSNIGTALTIAGEGDDGTDYLEEAVSYLKQALRQLSHESEPEFWAITQNSFGVAHMRLGEREHQPQEYEKAIGAFREALKVWTADRGTHNRALALTNLGAALHRLGESQNRTDLLEEAIGGYREALKLRRRESDPVNWSGSQNNLGNALSTLAKQQGRSDLLQEAIAAYRESLRALSREVTPIQWAETQNNLGVTLKELGEHLEEPPLVEEAVVALREGLLMGRRRKGTRAVTQEILAKALTYLGERDIKAKRYDDAAQRYEDVITAYDEVLNEWTIERNRDRHFHALGDQGAALLVVASLRGDISLAERSLFQYKAALEEYGDREGHTDCKARWQAGHRLAEPLVNKLRSESNGGEAPTD